ncbi:hypothetical protein HpCK35_32070 [Helicobacter pylori]
MIVSGFASPILQAKNPSVQKVFSFQKCRFRNCGTKHDRDINASINIRNYALGIIDDRYKIKLDKSRVGITQSYACKDSSSGVSKYGYILDTSYLSLKQEAHLL